MISIDTGVMRQLVSICSASNEEISEAVSALNSVTEHNDWSCKERDGINAYTIQNKSKIRILQDKSRSFLSILTTVSNEFETAESAITDMFSSLEGVLGTALTISSHPRTSTSQIPNNIYGIISGILNSDDSPLKANSLSNGLDTLSTYTVNNFFSEIPICNFDDIVLNGGQQ